MYWFCAKAITMENATESDVRLEKITLPNP